MTAGPTSPAAWVDRGLLLAQAGDADRAAADFARALELLPADFGVFSSRASLCGEMMGEPAAFDRLLAIRPSDAPSWYVRAGEHLARREWPAAIAAFVRGGEPPASSEFAVEYGAALLLDGAEAEYGRYVVRQAEKLGGQAEPFTHFVLARLAMLARRPAVPPPQIVDWASRAVAQGPGVAWMPMRTPWRFFAPVIPGGRRELRSWTRNKFPGTSQ